MKKVIAVCALFYSISQCQANSPSPLIQYKFKPGEITEHIQQAIAKARESLDALVQIPTEAKDFSNTILSLEHTMAEFFDRTQPIMFLKDVLVDEKTRNEALTCETLIRQFKEEVFMRKDLFLSFEATKQNLKKRSTPLDLEDQRLISIWDLKFQKSGVKLDGKTQEELHRLKAELITLEAEFENNINTHNDVIYVTAEELEGLPKSLRVQIESRGQGPDRTYTVSTKTAEYIPFMEYGESEAARKRLYEASTQGMAVQNMPLLERAFQVKAKIATLLGYDNWVAYQTDGLMAKNDRQVGNFLELLRGRMEPWYEKFYDILLNIKRETSPQANTLEPWEELYFSRKAMARLFDFSPEEVRNYFPIDRVVPGLLKVYAKTFRIEFQEIRLADIWHPSVRMYAITDAETGKPLGHFYLDLYPREGKFHYAEAEAPEIIKGRILPEGGYQRPVTALVANMPLPTQELPSLLSLDEVQTLSHELGHVLHEVSTEARYASFSGFLSEMDFSEVPAQLLEHSILDPQILDEISGHYVTGQKLPPALKAKIIEAQRFQMHLCDIQLLFLSLLDFELHTMAGRVDSRRVYLHLRQKIFKIQSIVGENFPANFGYLMDPTYAGTHYAYPWSAVIAKDLAQTFEEAHWDSSIGLRSRMTIFSQGGSRPAALLLRDFSSPLQDALEQLQTATLQRPLNIQTVPFTDAELNSMSRRLAGKYIDIFQRNSETLTPEQALREAARLEELPEAFIEKILKRDFLTELRRGNRKYLTLRNISEQFLRQFRKTLK